MISFADAAAEILAPWATPAQVREAARALGPEAEDLDFGSLSTAKKAALAQQLVRHLKHLAVDQAVEVHRQLQKLLEAEPRGDWYRSLENGHALVDLRTHLRQVLTALGYSWEEIFRLQASVCALGRWLEKLGRARVAVRSAAKEATVTLSALAGDWKPEAIAGSPMVAALKFKVQDLAVSRQGEEIVIEITVPAA